MRIQKKEVRKRRDKDDVKGIVVRKSINAGLIRDGPSTNEGAFYF